MQPRTTVTAAVLLLTTAALLVSMPGQAQEASKGHIAYSVKEGDAFAIHVMDADGKNDRTIPGLPGRVNILPSWSPDGKRLAFTSGDNLNARDFGVHVVNSDGTGLRRIAENEKMAVAPAWSPDGKTILCTVERDDAPSLVAFDAEGGGSRDVSTGMKLSVFGFFSPDGKQIGFSGAVDKNSEKMVDIYVANPDGSAVEKLTMGEGFRLGSPGAWSPDGKTIVYINANPEAMTATLNAIKLDGKQDQQLIGLKFGREIFDSIPCPSWSPDGKSMVICENADGRGAILRISADGKMQDRLTPAEMSAHCPAWSR